MKRWLAPWRAAGRTAAASLRADALPAGLVLGGVTLQRAVGRGSSAVVYVGTDAAIDAATDAALQVPCAVKVWNPHAGDAHDAVARTRFLEEARRTEALHHPGIARVHRSGMQDGRAYIVGEWFAGGSLARFVRPDHLLPEPLVLEIAQQLALALAHAHQQGVVHRDVKPANVLFDAAARRAALSDFGIARAPDAQASRSGVLIGSPAYMAPELLAGQAASASSDLYALAALTYELLAGQVPFAASSMGALLRAVAQAPPPPMGTLRADWPAAVATRLDRWFAVVLAKDPDQRPADGPAWAALAAEAARDAVPSWRLSASNATNPL